MSTERICVKVHIFINNIVCVNCILMQLIRKVTEPQFSFVILSHRVHLPKYDIIILIFNNHDLSNNISRYLRNDVKRSIFLNISHHPSINHYLDF